MKILSKDLYRLLRESLAPGLKAANFKRLRDAPLGWSREGSLGHCSFWFQCDRYGWFDPMGSSFTLEFQVAEDAGAATGFLGNRKRFFGLLSPSEREFVQRTNNDIKRSLKMPGPGSPVFLLPPRMQKTFMEMYQPIEEPHPPNHDVWLHYASEEHVAIWAGFFRERLVRMVEGFEAKIHEERRNA